MKKSIIAAICILIAFILQSSVFSNINIGGVVPNILIIITAIWGFTQGDMFGLLVGFFCGMLIDVFFGSFMGFYAILYMYIGYLNGKFTNLFLAEDIKLPLILVSLSDLIYGFVCYIFLFLLRGRFAFSYYLSHVIVPEVIMTILITLIIYPLFLLIHNRFLVEKR